MLSQDPTPRRNRMSRSINDRFNKQHQANLAQEATRSQKDRERRRYEVERACGGALPSDRIPTAVVRQPYEVQPSPAVNRRSEEPIYHNHNVVEPAVDGESERHAAQEAAPSFHERSTNDNTLIERELAQEKGRVKILESNIKVKDGERSNLKEQRNEARSKQCACIDDGNFEELQIWKRKVAALQELLVEYDKEIKELQEKLDEAEAKIRALEKELRRKDNEIEMGKDKADFIQASMQNRLDRKDEELEDLRRTLQANKVFTEPCNGLSTAPSYYPYTPPISSRSSLMNHPGVNGYSTEQLNDQQAPIPVIEDRLTDHHERSVNTAVINRRMSNTSERPPTRHRRSSKTKSGDHTLRQSLMKKAAGRESLLTTSKSRV